MKDFKMEKKVFALFMWLLAGALMAGGDYLPGGKKGPGGPPPDIGGTFVNLLPAENLSDIEKESLLKMREEEKLARDVYLGLYEQWELPIFENIAASEQKHMDAIKVLLDKYKLVDPVQDDTPGVFSDPQLKDLYDQLITQGLKSVEDALRVGATIEDLDIYDLRNYLLMVDNLDIVFVFGNLKKGSENHIRAFIKVLGTYGQVYTAQYISEADLQAILEAGNSSGNGYGWRGGGGRGPGNGNQ